MSAHDGALQAIQRILDLGGDADEVLRQVVGVLHRDYSWVGISFVEEGELVLGPAEGRRTAEPLAVPIAYDGKVVGEIDIDSDRPAAFGPEDREFLERVALLISPHCLVGWDTGGEGWSP